MVIFKYGIVIEKVQNEWRIGLLGENVNEHRCILVARNLFKFEPELGISVKVGFPNDQSEIPTVVQKCGLFEWIRDVKVIGDTVVIFAIVHFSSECMQRFYRKRRINDRLHYIIENSDTDFKQFSIPKSIVDREIAFRSNLQKPKEMVVYRVGICWDPTEFENGKRVEWRYFRDFPIVPIFELYWRDTAPPFLSESMVYGVLEGIVIAKAGDDSLFWSPRMGCAVLASATTSEQPSLGSVNVLLVKRMLPDNTFGFPCTYELLPNIIKYEWNELKIVVDRESSCVYLEVIGECSRQSEDGKVCMNVSHIGSITNGLEPYQNQLTPGRKYDMRVEFRKTEITYEPIIVDMRVNGDYDVCCRIVYVSQKLKTCFAVLDCMADNFLRYKSRINFIKIPFRTLFCFRGMRSTDVQLLKHCFLVTVPETVENQAIVDAKTVKGMKLAQNDGLYRVFEGRTWLRTIAVVKQYREQGPIDLMDPNLAQEITDFSRLSSNRNLSQNFAVQAQFALTPANQPMFLVRHVARVLMDLPKLTLDVLLSLPGLRDVFVSLFPPDTVEQVLPSLTPELFNNHNSFFDTPLPEDNPISPAHSVHTFAVEVDPNHSLIDRNFRPTIFEESVQTIQLEGDEGNEEGDATLQDRELDDTQAMSENQSIMGEIVTESCFDDTSTQYSGSSATSSTRGTSRITSTTARTVVHRSNNPSLFGHSHHRYTDETTSISSDDSLSTIGTRPRNSESSNFFRRKPLKYGIRTLHNLHDHKDMVFDMVYKNMDRRPLLLNCLRAATECWMNRPMGTVTTTKCRIVVMFGIELTDFTQIRTPQRLAYTQLIRFYTKCPDMELMDRTFVMPAGGLFPELPKGFHLGKPYSAYHFTFSPDRMVRIGGYAKDVGFEGLTAVQVDLNQDPKEEVMRDHKGHEWLRFETSAARLYTSYVVSEVFELWEGLDHQGWILVEKTPELMKSLEYPDPAKYTQDQYKCTVEPLAGGPVAITSLICEDNSGDHQLVMWRMVVEFSETVFHPRLYNRLPKIVAPPIPANPRIYTLAEARAEVDEYGTYKTMEINQQLAQERMDRLRALGDPRIKRFEGPDLAPEMERRNVDIIERRDNMMNTLKTLKRELLKLQAIGFFVNLTEAELEKHIDQYEEMHDNNHQFQFKKRTRSVVLGCNVLADLLVNGKLYKDLHRSPERDAQRILLMVSDCLGLNSTYVKKSEEAKKMLQYLYKNKLHSYI